MGQIMRAAMTVVVVAAMGGGGYACASGESTVSERPRPPTPVLSEHVGSGGYRATFSERGATLIRGADARFSIRAAAVGRPGATRALDALAPTKASETGATYAHAAGVTETFETRANGVEHGFVVAARPRGDGPLVVDVETSDDVTAAPEPTRPTDAVLRRHGEAFARYGGLVANDADGRVLPASFELAGGRLRVRVDDAAAHYPVAIDPLIWAQASTLLELHAQAEDFLGGGIGVDDHVMIAGISGRLTHRGGAAFYDRDGGTWTESSVYSLGLDASAQDQERGISAAIEGDTAIAGSRLHGLAFARDGGAWEPNGELEVPGWTLLGGPNGVNVALSGDTAVLSVPRWLPNYGDAAVNPPNTTAGALFLYQRTAGEWAGTYQINLPATPASFSQARVALQNDTLAVTTGNQVYVYVRVADGWQLQATLLPPSPSVYFFDGLALDGDTILAPTTTAADFTENYATFFERTGTTWSVTASIAEPSPQQNSTFGFAAALKGDFAFVTDYNRNGPGSAFRYSRTGGAWSLDEEVIPKGGESGDAFGFNLAMSKDTAVFAAPFFNFNRGKLFVLEDRSSLGDACTVGDTCASGICVDGVCCDTTCGDGNAGDCLACNVPSHLGTCSPEDKTYTCRRSVGDCDTAEVCDGTNTGCPADAVLANGATCSGGHCVAGRCEPDDAAAPPTTPAPSTASTPPSSDDGGCDMTPTRIGSRSGAVGLALIALLALARRRRRGATVIVAVFVATAVTFDARDARAELVWNQRQTFAPTGLKSGDFFGAGGLVIVGTTAYVSTAADLTNLGRVATYDRMGNDWTLGDQIFPSDPQVGQGFGSGISVSGDTLAVGAFRDSDGFGAAYVFVKTAAGWTQEAKLLPPLESDEYFGWAVAVSGDTLAVSSVIADGDRGAVYIYTRTAGVWTLGPRLNGDTSRVYFGSSLMFTDTTLAIGSGNFFAVQGNQTTPGTAYFYTGAGASWTLQQQLFPPAGDPLGRTPWFGTDVVIEGDTAIVSNGIDETDPPQGGRAYVYTRDNGTWTQTQMLQPSDSAYQDNFSSSGNTDAIKLHGDTMLIGAVGGNGGYGESYLFTRSGGMWKETTRFPSDVMEDEDFGAEADFTDDMILIGAGGGELVPGGPGAGKVYVFFHGSEGDPCTTGAPCSTGNCVDGVCCNSACGGDPNDCMACSVAAGAAVNGTCGPTTPHVCRKAVDDCDAPESCSGVDVACPVDLVAPNGQVCSAGTCSGGQCLAVIPLANTPAPNPTENPPTPTSTNADDGGCSFRTSRSPTPPCSVAAIGILIGLGSLRRRRYRARAVPPPAVTGKG